MRLTVCVNDADFCICLLGFSLIRIEALLVYYLLLFLSIPFLLIRLRYGKHVLE